MASTLAQCGRCGASFRAILDRPDPLGPLAFPHIPTNVPDYCDSCVATLAAEGQHEENLAVAGVTESSAVTIETTTDAETEVTPTEEAEPEPDAGDPSDD